MRLNEFYRKLLDIGLPAFKTTDIAVLCKISNQHASQLLIRLAQTKQVMQIKRGVWILPEKTQALQLPYFLTMPLPSYISLQSALYYHGMIMQIPEIVYAISIARTSSHQSGLASVSIHHISPELFFGYEEKSSYLNMATPEKALFDFLYLNQTRSRKFAKLPELELTDQFDKALIMKYIDMIPSPNRRQRVKHLLTDLLDKI